MKGQKYSDDKPPLFTALRQFKHAFTLISMRSMAGHEKYIETDEDWENFSRVENPQFQYNNSSIRHALGLFGNESEAGHKAAAAWNALASLEMYVRHRIEDGDDFEDILNEVIEV